MLTIGLVTLILAIGLHWIGSRILLHGFTRIEKAQVHEHLARAIAAFAAMQEDLSVETRDWAAWNDAYEFMEARDPAFLRTNITFAGLSALRVDVIAFVHSNGRVIIAHGVDYDNQRLVEAPAGLLHRLETDPRLTDLPTPDSGLQGILSLPEGLLVFAARPILTSDYRGPVHGTLVFGRLLNSHRMADITRQLQAPIATYALARDNLPADCIAARDVLTAAGAPRQLVRGLQDDVVAGYCTLADMDNPAGILLKVQTPRRVMRQGHLSVQYLKAAILLTGTFCGILMLMLLKRLVLNRLSRLNGQLCHIAASSDPALRVQMEGGDELTDLAGHINAVLAARDRSEKVLRLTQFSVDRAPEAIVWIGPDADVLYANQAACRALDYSRDEMLRMKVFNYNPEFQPDNWPIHWNRIAQRGNLPFESVHRTRTGRIFPVEITANMLDYGGQQCVCAFIRDITWRKRDDERLRYAALHDALTGLPNRAMLCEHLERAIKRAARDPDHHFAVMFLDLDRFKIINDSLGHQAGDELLIAISHRLQACIEGDEGAFHHGNSQLARLGGDEFIILLDGIGGIDDATHLAGRMQQELAEPFNLGGRRVHITVSIGIVSSEIGYESAADLLRDADTAMYRAKAGGKAQYVVFDRHMHDAAMARLQLETDLRRAIERDELDVAYQPIVSLETGELEGFEALARWQHPERGEIAPDDFIPIAEETGLILVLGQKVLRHACRQWRRFQEQTPEASPLTMSINISKRQLMDSGLPEQMRELLADTGVPANALMLEVTESVIMQDAEAITPMLAELKKLGFRLAMDDFGRGHSSLGCLHRFPLDYLKIDRAFVSNMGIMGAELNIEYTAIVQAVVTLAHNLGMQVVAEGVEHVGQLVQLQALGCGFAQGFHFSPPVSPDAAIKLIQTRGWLSTAELAGTLEATW